MLCYDGCNICCCRGNETTIYIFDQSMAIIPFATLTDMIEALKMSASGSIHRFLSGLLACKAQHGLRAGLARDAHVGGGAPRRNRRVSSTERILSLKSILYWSIS